MPNVYNVSYILKQSCERGVRSVTLRSVNDDLGMMDVNLRLLSACPLCAPDLDRLPPPSPRAALQCIFSRIIHRSVRVSMCSGQGDATDVVHGVHGPAGRPERVRRADQPWGQAGTATST